MSNVIQFKICQKKNTEDYPAENLKASDYSYGKTALNFMQSNKTFGFH